MELGPNGRHDIATRARVGEPDGGVPLLEHTSMAFVFEAQLIVERSVRELPAVRPQRVCSTRRRMRKREQVWVPPQPF